MDEFEFLSNYFFGTVVLFCLCDKVSAILAGLKKNNFTEAFCILPTINSDHNDISVSQHKTNENSNEPFYDKNTVPMKFICGKKNPVELCHYHCKTVIYSKKIWESVLGSNIFSFVIE